MLILIDKTKTRIVQVKLQWKTKKREKIVPLCEQMTGEHFPGNVHVIIISQNVLFIYLMFM